LFLLEYDGNCNIFRIITDRLNQYRKVVCKERNSAKRDSSVCSLHQ